MNSAAAHRQMRKIVYCAERAGIAQHVWISYGTLLGYVREGDVIDHDTDTDISIFSDRITAEQEKAFYQELDTKRCYFDEKKPSWLFEVRRKMQKRSDGRIFHLSLKEDRNGVKSCIWFQFAYKGYMWHSKGANWTAKIGSRHGWSPYLEAVAKGVPLCLFQKMEQIEWKGGKYWIPALKGSILDAWYPNWGTPRVGGCSAAEAHLLIPKWNDKSGWKIHISGS